MKLPAQAFQSRALTAELQPICWASQRSLNVRDTWINSRVLHSFMAMSNLAISIGNYWQGIVAERVDYAMVLYLDSVLVIIPRLLIPFLRNREAPSQIGPSLGVAGEPAA